jgi:UDP-N-acetylmuramate dehydrogenase
MPVPGAIIARLTSIPDLRLTQDAPLSLLTRFQIGGPAAVLCDALSADASLEALRVLETTGTPREVIGGGTNLVVSDEGFDGVALRYAAPAMNISGTLIDVDAGAVLQDLVDWTIEHGLKGLETMTGIPGLVGGAVYGNAGAYGRSIQEILRSVTFTDGKEIRTIGTEDCEFRYRESIFKQRKDWLILSTELQLQAADRAELLKTATGIRTVRDKKYPPDMKCAGSIFKNLFFADLPANVQGQVPPELVREGKVPSAWFLEQTGVKGLRRGDIQVANYHANLIYNDGAGSAADLVAVIRELKQRVKRQFGFELEEEVQFVGFNYAPASR